MEALGLGRQEGPRRREESVGAAAVNLRVMTRQVGRAWGWREQDAGGASREEGNL